MKYKERRTKIRRGDFTGYGRARMDARRSKQGTFMKRSRMRRCCIPAGMKSLLMYPTSPDFIRGYRSIRPCRGEDTPRKMICYA